MKYECCLNRNWESRLEQSRQGQPEAGMRMVCTGSKKESLLGVENLWGGTGWGKLGGPNDRGLKCTEFPLAPDRYGGRESSKVARDWRPL